MRRGLRGQLVLPAVLLALAGCAEGPRTSASAACGIAACGVDRAALLKVTAAQLVAPEGEITVYDIRDYPGATTVWRARRAGASYQCREARDPAAPDHVKFVYCRPET